MPERDPPAAADSLRGSRDEAAADSEAGRSRRTFFKAGAAGLAIAAGAGAGAAGMRYEDTASARRRAEGATIAERSPARGVRVLWRAETTEKVMALTFDDGPGTTLTAPLLDVLAQEGVRVTFSLVGQRAHEQRDLVRRQVQRGHELANHSWSHADLSLLDGEALAAELDRTDQLLSDLSGRRPFVIRPPYGRVNGVLLQHAALRGQQILLWDIRFQESRLDSAGNAAYVLSNMGPGSVVLGHDNGSANRHIGTQAVPEIVREAKRRGYTFVTASEMFDRDRS